jgi:GDPmannose 4,6-dehydratase
LGWIPEHDLASLVKDMMQSDVTLMQKEQYLKAGGYHSSKILE